MNATAIVTLAAYVVLMLAIAVDVTMEFAAGKRWQWSTGQDVALWAVFVAASVLGVLLGGVWFWLAGLMTAVVAGHYYLRRRRTADEGSSQLPT